MDLPKRYLSDAREGQFPGLRRDDYRVMSDADEKYNCIAHAAGINTIPWWPEEISTEEVFWPPGVPREVTIAAFVAAFAFVGYRPCEPAEDGPAHLPGFEKIAIYLDRNGVPLHAARQTDDGTWTSKLGRWEVIQHKTLESLSSGEDESRGYGTPSMFLIRKVP